ncbi:MOSC domain-containing protein [Amnibacterium sp. CER49]|uniref:MOSC domain-containing protein n=1 Tax=Amnibacterium sp. CER49 TaxID=3039161 RepID=UPI002449E8EC|nr:MOSC N-terminal beta barrel domain-containing protein [Amnibacterium sp. CER49]MDH2445516.1 MOSC domain-containing protein [Amnibacterium sp. CER49]
MTTATVARLWRYPIKSTAGEELAEARLDGRGLELDRVWAAYTADGGIASGKTTRRFRKVEGLLHWRSATGAEAPRLIAPDGTGFEAGTAAADDALARALGQPLALRREADVPHHDDSAVHLVTTAAIRAVEGLLGARFDPARARANLLIDLPGEGFVEDDWLGAELAVGDEVVLRLDAPMVRCVMVDASQAGVTVERQALQALGRAHDVELGLQASVVRTGTIHVEDVARLLHRSPGAGSMA